MKELLAGKTSVIRKRLKIEWLYASQMDDPKNTSYRIIGAKTVKGGLQVQSESGIWFTPNEVWRRTSM